MFPAIRYLLIKKLFIIMLFPSSLHAVFSPIETYNEFQKIFPEFGQFIKTISIPHESIESKGELLRTKVMEIMNNSIDSSKKNLMQRFESILSRLDQKQGFGLDSYEQAVPDYTKSLMHDFTSLSFDDLMYRGFLSIESWFKHNVDTEYERLKFCVETERNKHTFFEHVDWFSVVSSYVKELNELMRK